MTEPSQTVDSVAGAQLAKAFLAGILERMDIRAEVSLREDGDRITLDIETEEIERVIGRRGQVVDALQHLVGKHLARQRTEERQKPVVVDAGGYRQKQIERLEALALRMAERVVDEGMPVELAPMSAHDRRIIHMALAERPDVRTESEGQGDGRHVVVLPAAAE